MAEVPPLASASAVYAVAVFGTPCELRHQLPLFATVTSLRRTSPRFSVVAMLGGACWEDSRLAAILGQLGVHRVHVPIIREVKCSNYNQSVLSSMRWATSYTIANVWGLTRWAAVLFFDSDVAIVRNVDHLLERMLARPEIGEMKTPQGCLNVDAAHHFPNTGVWAVRPNRTVLSSLRNYMATTPIGCRVGLQDVHVQYFSRLPAKARHRFGTFEQVALPVRYNMKAGDWPSCFRRDNFSADDVFVVHWSGKRKPRRGLYPQAHPLQRRALDSYLDTLCGWAAFLNATVSACEPSAPPAPRVQAPPSPPSPAVALVASAHGARRAGAQVSAPSQAAAIPRGLLGAPSRGLGRADESLLRRERDLRASAKPIHMDLGG